MSANPPVPPPADAALRELPELVKFFRYEEPAWGDRGDYEGWSPERTAIEMIRRLRFDLEAAEERLRIAESTPPGGDGGTSHDVPSGAAPAAGGTRGERDFEYLLNAMEQAAQADNPAALGYGDKRKAVFAYVAGLRAALAEAEAHHQREMAELHGGLFERHEAELLAAEARGRRHALEEAANACNEARKGQPWGNHVAYVECVYAIRRLLSGGGTPTQEGKR